MPWFVRYRESAADLIVRMRTPQQAIETACRLLDDGADVYAIGTGPLTNSIERAQIDRIYEMWVKTRPPSCTKRGIVNPMPAHSCAVCGAPAKVREMTAPCGPRWLCRDHMAAEAVEVLDRNRRAAVEGDADAAVTTLPPPRPRTKVGMPLLRRVDSDGEFVGNARTNIDEVPQPWNRLADG